MIQLDNSFICQDSHSYVVYEISILIKVNALSTCLLIPLIMIKDDQDVCLVCDIELVLVVVRCGDLMR